MRPKIARKPSPRRGEGRERGLDAGADLDRRAPSPQSSPRRGEEVGSDYVVPQSWESFTADDHAVWDLLFARQVELLGTRVVSPSSTASTC